MRSPAFVRVLIVLAVFLTANSAAGLFDRGFQSLHGKAIVVTENVKPGLRTRNTSRFGFAGTADSPTTPAVETVDLKAGAQTVLGATVRF